MLKLLDKHRDAKPSAFVRLCSPRFPLHCPFTSASQLSAEQGSNSCPLSCYRSFSVRCSLWGSAQLLHFISVRRFASFTPLLHYFFFLYFSTLFFWEWLVFAMFLCVCASVCVCESRFCVQVRSFNFDLCFRLFCVAFVDFCHLNRNFYFLHVSGHGRGRELELELASCFMVLYSSSRRQFLV